MYLVCLLFYSCAQQRYIEFTIPLANPPVDVNVSTGLKLFIPHYRVGPFLPTSTQCFKQVHNTLKPSPAHCAEINNPRDTCTFHFRMVTCLFPASTHESGRVIAENQNLLFSLHTSKHAMHPPHPPTCLTNRRYISQNTTSQHQPSQSINQPINQLTDQPTSQYLPGQSIKQAR